LIPKTFNKIHLQIPAKASRMRNPRATQSRMGNPPRFEIWMSTNVQIWTWEVKMTKGDRVYVVENYLVEELTAALLAGEVGLAVTFECHANAARVHVTDSNGAFWEIPTTAVCTVPEGHLSNLYDEPCPACGLQLFTPQPSHAPVGVDVLRPFRPTVNLGFSPPYTPDSLRQFMRSRYPGVEDEGDDEHPLTAIGVVLLSAVILGTTDTEELIRFTGYSREFVSAIAVNMEDNRAWWNGRYDLVGWLLTDGTIDDCLFWEHINVACAMVSLPGALYKAEADPCKIFWEERGDLA
jgi:hypothetical protein